MFNFRRSLSAALMAVLAAATGVVAGSAPTSAAPASTTGPMFSTTTIVNRATIVVGNPMCLDVPGGSTSNQLQVQQYNCNGGTNQQWEYIPGATPGYGQLRNVASQKCLDVRDTSSAAGAVVQQYICMNVPNQQWLYDSSSGYLMAMHSGGCAAVYALVYKSKAHQEVCGGGSAPYPIFTRWNASI
ncbi:RICIN domain-containing protein [Micromonospora sp. NPDC001898]|uniref:RICIN domain-containing protein n=1 Tax=Micromonospora sp. NPDC001898 TaxID=3364221 RepID=UPI0036775E2B